MARARESPLALARRLRRDDELLFALWALTTVSSLCGYAVLGALVGLALFGHVFGVPVDPAAVVSGTLDAYATGLAQLG